MHLLQIKHVWFVNIGLKMSKMPISSLSVVILTAAVINTSLHGMKQAALLHISREMQSRNLTDMRSNVAITAYNTWPATATTASGEAHCRPYTERQIIDE